MEWVDNGMGRYLSLEYNPDALRLGQTDLSLSPWVTITDPILLQASACAVAWPECNVTHSPVLRAFKGRSIAGLLCQNGRVWYPDVYEGSVVFVGRITMELNSVSKSDLLHSVLFSGRTKVLAKSLSGFEKRFRIPEEDDQRLLLFGKMAAGDVEKDLDTVFDKLKSVFGFKRRQLQVEGPVDGSGSIATPGFQYRIDLMLDPDAEKNVVWQRSVGRITEPDLVFSDEFHKAFGESLGFLQVDLCSPLDIESIIDHVEDAPGDQFQIDYDREATWCEIKTTDSVAVMRIDRDLISVKAPTALSPSDLFECYRQLQDQFLETIDLPGNIG